MAEKKKTPKYYLRLPYERRVRLIEEDDGSVYFLAEVVELPGLEADGATPEEAHFNLLQAFQDYIQAMLSWAEEIPEPKKALRSSVKAIPVKGTRNGRPKTVVPKPSFSVDSWQPEKAKPWQRAADDLVCV